MNSVDNSDLEKSLLHHEEDEDEEEEDEEDEPEENPRLMLWASCPGRVRLQQVHSNVQASTRDVQRTAPDSLLMSSALTPPTPDPRLGPIRGVVYAGSVFTNLMMACLAPFFEEHASTHCNISPGLTGAIFAIFPLVVSGNHFPL